MNITGHINGTKSHPHSFINWFVLESMGQNDAMRVLENCIQDKKEYDLKMSLNGIELNPVQSLELLWSQVDEMIEKRANEKAQKLLGESKEKLDAAVKQFIDSLGLKEEDYE